MTTVGSAAAGVRGGAGSPTGYYVSVALYPDDLKMIRAFMAWNVASPRCNPKKKEIEYGYGDHTFHAWNPRTHRPETLGPRVFARLVALGVIEHSRNGHCWLSVAGATLARALKDEAA